MADVFSYPIHYGTFIADQGTGSTINLTADSVDFTGNGTTLTASAQPGDMIFAQGKIGVVAEITSDVTGKLAYPWTGTTGNFVNYVLQRWLQHTDGRWIGLKVTEYFTDLTKIPAQNAAFTTEARAWAENAIDVAIPGYAGSFSSMHWSNRSKDWATKTDAEVIAGQGYGSKKYALDSAASATASNGFSLASYNWANYAANTDVPGGGVGSRSSYHWSSAAASSAAAASASSTLSSQWSQYAEDTVVPGQAAGSFSSFHWSRKSAASATASAASQLLSLQFAQQAEDVQVPGFAGSFSSYHWSRKSLLSATASANSATLASQWAGYTEDVVVPGQAAGNYSAYHWNRKALASAAAAALTLTNFKNAYYGPLAADPATRPDGSAVADGDVYYRTTAPIGLKIRDQGVWSTAFLSASGALAASNNLSDLTNKASARANLQLGSAALLDTGTASGQIPLLGSGGKLSSTLLALVKADVGLSHVDDTADLDKPVSTAQQAALNLKEDVFRYADKATLAAGSPTAAVVAVLMESGETQYIYDAATASPSAIMAANGRKYRNKERILTPEMFGGGVGVADNKQAFIDLASELRWRGGGIVRLKENGTYTVWATSPGSGNVRTFDLSGCKGVRFEFNGATINSPLNYELSANAYQILLFYLTNTQDITIDNMSVNHSAMAVRTFAGLNSVYAVDKNDGINLTGRTLQRFGGGGLTVSTAAAWGTSTRSRLIDLENGDFQGVMYPCSFQKNGDDFTGKYRTVGSARSLYLYGVRNHKVDLDSTGGWPGGSVEPNAPNDVLIWVNVVTTDNIWGNSTENIDLKYTRMGIEDTASQYAYVSIGGGLLSGMAANGAGRLRNIKVWADIEAGFYAPSAGIELIKNPSGSAGFDATIEMSNIEIGGMLMGMPAGGVEALSLLKAMTATDTARNIRVKDMIIDSAGLVATLNGASVKGPVVLENFRSNQALNVSPQPPTGYLDVSRGVDTTTFKSVSSAAQVDGGGNPIWWRYLPNGMIEQGGNFPCGPGFTSITFPKTFRASTQPSDLKAQIDSSSGAPAAINVAQFTNASFSVNRPAGVASESVRWSAKGWY